MPSGKGESRPTRQEQGLMMKTVNARHFNRFKHPIAAKQRVSGFLVHHGRILPKHQKRVQKQIYVSQFAASTSKSVREEVACNNF